MGGARWVDCGEWSLFHKGRCEIKTLTPDGGLEQDITSMPCLYQEGFSNVADVVNKTLAGTLEIADRNAWFLPECIVISDFLHIIFNALEEVCKSHPLWKEADPHLKAIAGYLSVRDLRNVFISKCLTDPRMRSLFRSWSINTHFSWKWEYLERFLRELLPRLDALISRFDAQKIRGRGTDDKDSALSAVFNAHITTCKDALEWVALKSCVLVLHAVCLAVRRFVRWLESCRCHSHLLQPRPGDGVHTARQRYRRRADRGQPCFPKGTLVASTF